MNLQNAYEKLEAIILGNDGSYVQSCYNEIEEMNFFKKNIFSGFSNKYDKNKLAYLVVCIIHLSAKYNSVTISQLVKNSGQEYASVFTMYSFMQLFERFNIVETIQNHSREKHILDKKWRPSEKLLECIRTDRPFTQSLYEALLLRIVKNRLSDKSNIGRVLEEYQDDDPIIKKVRGFDLEFAETFILLLTLKDHISFNTPTSLSQFEKEYDVAFYYVDIIDMLESSSLIKDGVIQYLHAKQFKEVIFRLGKPGLIQFELKPLPKGNYEMMIPPCMPEEKPQNIDYYLDLINKRGGVENLTRKEFNNLKYSAGRLH